MMEPGMIVLIAIAGYLIGGISFPRLVSRLASPKTDVENVEIRAESGFSLHPSSMGATTVSAALGWKVGCAASLMDMVKVFLPTLALRLLLPNTPYFLVYALFCVIGNNWPVYYRFHGGWGVSAIYGGLLAVDPLGALVTVVASFLLGILLRDWMILFLSSIWLMVPWLWFRTHDWMFLAYILAVNLAMFVKLWPETKLYLKSPRIARIEKSGLASQVPMGRGLIKMLDMLGLSKEK